MEQFLENIKDLEVTTVARAQEAIDKKEIATKVLVKRDRRRHKLQSAFTLSSKIKVRIFPDL